MKNQLYTSIQIAASAQKVWQILTQFENYPNWNPFVKSIKGKVKPGEIIEVYLAPHKGKAMKFTPVVIVFNENKLFSWRGKLWASWLFFGEHSFQLISQEDGSTILIHSEIFGGILFPLLKKSLMQDTKKDFELMNEKLKALAEMS